MDGSREKLNLRYSNIFLFRPEKWKIIAPIWFNWLRWFLMVGAVGYLAEKTNNIGLQIIYGISYIAFFYVHCDYCK